MSEPVVAKMAQTADTANETLVLVLVGRLGVGKSATANYLSKSTTFKSQRSSTAITLACQDATFASADGNPVIIVDTPGLGNPEVTREEVQKEIFEHLKRIDQRYSNCKFGILFVLGLHTRLTDDDLKEFGLLGTIFGLHFYEHSFSLWTHADLLPADADFNSFSRDNGDSMNAFLRDVQKGEPLLLNATSQFDVKFVQRVLQTGTSVAAPLKRITMIEMRGKKARRMRQAELRKRGELSPAEPAQGFFSSLYTTIFGEDSTTFRSTIAGNSTKSHVV